MSKVIVIGKGGMLGHQVVNAVHPDYAYGSEDYDFRSCADIEALIETLDKDDIVINCVGRLRQAMSKNPTPGELADAFMLNAFLPRSLAKHCRLIHISTDCVFSGRKGNYVESDLPDGEDEYARTKALGDVPGEAMVIRTSIIGLELKSRLGLMEWFLQQEKANGFTNHYWNGLTTNELARIIKIIIESDLYERGLFHVHGETASKWAILEYINEFRREKAEINPVDAAQRVDRTLATINPQVWASNVKPLREQIEIAVQGAI